MDDFAVKKYIELLKQSIQINTVNPPGNEHALAKMYVDYLTREGIEAWLEPVQENRSNFVAKLDGISSSAGNTVFCGHLDTVPVGTEQWLYDPFAAKETNGKIYGRGAADMKSGLAAMAAAFVELKKSPSALAHDLYLIGTVGEEVDCLGSKSYLSKHGMNHTELLVIGEPTDCEVITQQKGAAWVKVNAFGKTAHGSMPELGENAIYYINSLISALTSRKAAWESKRNSVLGTATISVNQITGGSAPNMVADECSVLIDFRLLPGQPLSDVTEFMNLILEELSVQYPNITAEYAVVNHLKPIASAKESDQIRTAIEISSQLSGTPYQERGLNFFTDASVLTEKAGYPVVFYGPGEDTLAHQINEYVHIDKYLQAIAFYKRFAIACDS